ncbi:hypothetical protein [Streptomyces sp. NPDC002088]|uniref:hypothetical protein n=1 Tax=Streptomyces sp. NPDC002088 TaxID=3154665 RepID=UPI00331DB9BE
MDFFGGVDAHELFLSRCRYLSVGSVPAFWGVTVFFIKEEGWYFSFLLCFVLPLIAAYLGVRGQREIRTGLAATGLALAAATLPLTFLLASVEGA